MTLPLFLTWTESTPTDETTADQLRIALGACMLLFVGERTMHDDDGAAAERRAYAAVAEGEALRLPPAPLPAEELLPASPEASLGLVQFGPPVPLA